MFFSSKDTIPKKNSKAIIYNVFQSFSRPEGDFILMAYYSLKTLFEKTSKIDFDTIVFLDSDNDFDFLNYIHLEKYSLIKDFPNVIFVQSDYSKIEDDKWMAKWFHIEKTFKYNYEKVLYLDVDTRFFKAPNEIFSYEKNKVYTNFEGLHKATKVVINQNGINSGVVFLDKFCFNKIPNFFKTIVKTRERLNKKAKEHFKKEDLTENEYDSFCYFSEQYGAQITFLEYNIEIKPFDYHKINIIPGIQSLDVIWKSEGDHIINNPPEIILHYSSNSAFAHLPFELKTKKYIKQFNEKILNLTNS